MQLKYEDRIGRPKGERYSSPRIVLTEVPRKLKKAIARDCTRMKIPMTIFIKHILWDYYFGDLKEYRKKLLQMQEESTEIVPDTEWRP